MVERVLLDLLSGNRTHTDGLPEDYFADVQDAQHPSVVSMCCSDSRVSQEGMWSVDRPGQLFTPSTIGNQVWETSDGDRVIDGNVLFPIEHAGTRTVVVVGHTGCGAVTAAYEAVTGDVDEGVPAIAKLVDNLVPVVEDGLDAMGLAATPEEHPEDVVDRLVEYNVDRQVQFLRGADQVPAEASVYGFVYDFQAVYGDVPGRTYLVNDRGETDPDAIRETLPGEYAPFAKRLQSDPGE